MEDYLEMIARLSENGEPVRVGVLARKLHVTPSSASKMIAHLAENGCVYTERYGYITLTEYGRSMGVFLVRRHGIIHRFFCLLNGSEEELTQTEKVEHFIEPHTLAAMERFLDRFAK
ncbi:MAG: metal-dependent transcriptional regulator [Clostridia bacterium]|nr:metal-dependent transcriptional regulator [Clostridia bacterium]